MLDMTDPEYVVCRMESGKCPMGGFTPRKDTP